jgi:hypothetical protein
MGWSRRWKNKKQKELLDPRLPKSPAALFFEEEWIFKTLDEKNLFSKSYWLEDIGELDQEICPRIYAGVDQKALVFGFDFSSLGLTFPGKEASDGIEIFIDTRPGLSKGITKFCHQFALSFDEGPHFLEVTSFRAKEDSHEKANPRDLKIVTQKGLWTLKIPLSALHGLLIDGHQSVQIGFALTLQISGVFYPILGASIDTSYTQYPGLWKRAVLELS